MRILITFLACISILWFASCEKEEISATSEPLPAVEEILQEKEVQMVGDVEVVIDKDMNDEWSEGTETLDPIHQDWNTETQEEEEPKEETPEPDRDYDAELDAFLEEILSAVE